MEFVQGNRNSINYAFMMRIIEGLLEDESANTKILREYKKYLDEKYKDNNGSIYLNGLLAKYENESEDVDTLRQTYENN